MNESKDLSVYELFKKLQEEYVVCIIRTKIYPIRKHKDYWNKLAKKKKEKIEDISLRNRIPSMFYNENNDDWASREECERVERKIENEVYNENGMPNFYYPNVNKEEQQRYWDEYNYYYPNSEVRVEIDGKIRVGKIERTDIENKITTININGVISDFDFNEVTRIL